MEGSSWWHSSFKCSYKISHYTAEVTTLVKLHNITIWIEVWCLGCKIMHKAGHQETASPLLEGVWPVMLTNRWPHIVKQSHMLALLWTTATCPRILHFVYDIQHCFKFYAPALYAFDNYLIDWYLMFSCIELPIHEFLCLRWKDKVQKLKSTLTKVRLNRQKDQ